MAESEWNDGVADVLINALPTERARSVVAKNGENAKNCRRRATFADHPPRGDDDEHTRDPKRIIIYYYTCLVGRGDVNCSNHTRSAAAIHLDRVSTPRRRDV